MEIPKIGQLIEDFDRAKRDAIHIAIIPIEAGMRLDPGQFVQIREEKGYVGDKAASVGVVDPFLNCVIYAGERFYLFLHPGSITSLRHDWEHPAFPAAVALTFDKAISIRWLKTFAARNQVNYEDMLAIVKDGSFCFPYDASVEVPDDFWFHYEVATGLKVEDKTEHFRCAC